MATSKSLQPREPRPLQLLRHAARAAEGLPGTGGAMRRLHDTESWALNELKQRLDGLDTPDGNSELRERGQQGSAAPADMLANLLTQSHGVNAATAKARLYRQTLSRMVPDQVAMYALLADRGRAPLCHVAASRLPAGPISMVVLANASSLGRDAGVLLRDYVPHYVSAMLQMGLFEIGPDDHSLAKDFEMLQADTLVRKTMERIRSEMKLYPRLQRFSVGLSDFGHAMWRDCQPDSDFSDRDTSMGANAEL